MYTENPNDVLIISLLNRQQIDCTLARHVGFSHNYNNHQTRWSLDRSLTPSPDWS